MTFKLPATEALAKLSLEELTALHDEAVTASLELSAVSDEEITDEQLAQLESLASDIDVIVARRGEVEAAAAERAERLATARGKVDAAKAAKVEDEPEEEATEDTAPVEEIPDDASELVDEEEKETVTASGKNAVARVAKRAPAVIIHEPEEVEADGSRTVLIAAANVPSFDSGAELKDFSDLTKAYLSRSRGFAGSKAKGRFDRYGVARIEKPSKGAFALNNQSAEEQMRIIDEAANEKNLPGNSLVAAGGWCAPSETVYDLCSQATATGLISVPEVVLSRGGIRYSKGVDYAALALNWGFIQTEAEAEAGTEKVCYEVPCPPFEEHRLDAIGFCITAGVLTEAAYPELISQVLDLGLIAFAHKINAEVIKRISALIGTAVDYTESGSATSDILDAIAINGAVIRTRYSLDPEATLEAIFPVWAKEIIRADLSRRTGVDLLAVSDADITRYFAARNVAAQWVYDYQPLDVAPATAGKAWPATVEFLLYPAGAYVKGTTSVIDLDTVYDSVGLSTNTYTAAFYEEGLVVFNRCMGGVKVSVATGELLGITGAAELTNGAVITE